MITVIKQSIIAASLLSALIGFGMAYELDNIAITASVSTQTVNYTTVSKGGTIGLGIKF